LVRFGKKIIENINQTMGCNASKEESRVTAENEFFVKPVPGPPTKTYPYVEEGGKPKVLGSGAYSTVYEASDKVSIHLKNKTQSP
jgi:hypothetical protein